MPARSALPEAFAGRGRETARRAPGRGGETSGSARGRCARPLPSSRARARPRRRPPPRDGHAWLAMNSGPAGSHRGPAPSGSCARARARAVPTAMTAVPDGALQLRASETARRYGRGGDAARRGRARACGRRRVGVRPIRSEVSSREVAARHIHARHLISATFSARQSVPYIHASFCMFGAGVTQRMWGVSRSSSAARTPGCRFRHDGGERLACLRDRQQRTRRGIDADGRTRQKTHP
jgi:hypothetical protein